MRLRKFVVHAAIHPITVTVGSGVEAAAYTVVVHKRRPQADTSGTTMICLVIAMIKSASRAKKNRKMDLIDMTSKPLLGSANKQILDG